MCFPWEELPEDLAEALMQGGVGRMHLTSVGLKCLELSRLNPTHSQRYMALAFETLSSAWACSPLNLKAAELVLSFFHSGLAGDSQLNKLAQSVIKIYQKRNNNERESNRINAIIDSCDFEKAFEFASNAIYHSKFDISILQSVQKIGMLTEHAGRVAEIISRPWPSQLHPIQSMLLADLSFARKDWSCAIDLYRSVLDAGVFPEVRIRIAGSYLRLGERQLALKEFFQAYLERPWNVNILLRLSDLIDGIDAEITPLPGKVAILLYSFNNAHELNAALTAVFRNKLDDAFVVVLNNGCSDDTVSMLDSWDAYERKSGEKRLFRVNLPINIGAPAARNWLLHLPQVADADFVAYLDDDALPPLGWLDRLGTAVKRFPDAGAWGCKVVDAYAPLLIQSADLHMKSEANTRDCERSLLHASHVRMTDIHLQTLDFGEFDYLRAGLSVTGCCHVFRTAELIAAGGFDLHFSPSQFDDLDRDLAFGLKNKPAIYQGHLSVLHQKRSGKLASKDYASSQRAFGNLCKLNLKYSSANVKELRKFDVKNMVQHILKCQRNVALALN